jgi:HAE1 family hydrophobic/amphiphilic exporter-1
VETPVSLPDLAVRRPITVFMATIALIVFGGFAILDIPVELLPDLSYPSLTVQTTYPDAAPVSVEQFITRPVEEVVGVLSGLRDIHSSSRAGLSEVVLVFDWDENMDILAMEVREKLGLAQLPREADPPRVLRFDPALEPLIRLSFTGDRSLSELRQLADRWLKPILETVDGVAAAKVRGGLDPEIQILADEDILATLGLTLDDLADALRQENINQPGGTIRDWGAVYLVRTLHEYTDLEQIRKTIVADVGQGFVRVEDVAEVRRGHKDRKEITRYMGEEIVEIAIHREGSANSIQVSETFREELEQIRDRMEDDLQLTILSDQSVYISRAIDQVWSAAVIGGILAILVLFFFLKDLPSTLIVALTIPVSVLVAFLGMGRAGVSLNIMSLGGLALGVGMLVDNSIVVLEAIDRKRRTGLDRVRAAAEGAGEVAGAVTAATLTTICVFFPIVFVKGVAGQLFYDLAVTVCLSLLASLVVSLSLIPALSKLSIQRAGASTTLFGWDQDDLAHATNGTDLSMGLQLLRFTALGVWQRGHWSLLALDYTVLLPFRIIAFPLGLLFLMLQFPADIFFNVVSRFRIGSMRLPAIGNPAHPAARLITVYLFPLRLVGGILVFGILQVLRLLGLIFRILTFPAFILYSGLEKSYPAVLRSAVRYRWIVLPGTLTLFVAVILLVPGLGRSLVPDLSQGEFAFRLRAVEGTPLETMEKLVARVETGLEADPRFRSIFSVTGSVPSSASGRATFGENLAQINLVLEGEDIDENAAVQRVRALIDSIGSLEGELVRPAALQIQDPVAVRVFSDNLADLETSSARIASLLEPVPGIADITTSSEPGNPEIRIELDREKAGALGLAAETIGASLRRQIQGELAGEFREGEQRIDIRLRASESDRSRASQVAALRVRLDEGPIIPVSAVAEVSFDRGPAAIHRISGARVTNITASVAGRSLGAVLDDITAVLAGIDLPRGAVLELAGQNQDMQQSFDSLKLALGLAVFLVYVVMAMQFESLLHPFVILFSVPLGITGVVLALFVTGTDLNVLAFIGVVMLAGIVVNNAIVLIDAVNRHRSAGKEIGASLIEAGRERFRPIIMTTTTTVLALLPMVLGSGAGNELRRPMAITVIGGLSVATLLTLLFIPSLYRLLSRGKKPAGEPT